MIDSVDYKDMLKYLRESGSIIKEVMSIKLLSDHRLSISVCIGNHQYRVIIINIDEFLKWTILQDLKKEVEK
jgi:hypothetical protein